MVADLASASSAPVSGMRLLQAAWSVSLPCQMNTADCHTAVSAVTAVQLIEVLTRASVWEWGRWGEHLLMIKNKYAELTDAYMDFNNRLRLCF